MALPPGTAAQIISRAMAQLRSGDADGAHRSWLTLPRQDQQHPDCLFVFGLIAKAKGDLPSALNALSAALKQESKIPQLWKAYADVLDEMGNRIEALSALDRATALAPGYVDAWHDIVVITLGLGLGDLAEAALNKLTDVKPHDPRIVLLRAHVAQAKGDFDAAVEGFRAVLTKNPENLRARYNLAVCLRQSDQVDAALIELEATLGQRLDTPETHTLKAHLLADLGDFDASITQYRHVIKQYPDYVDAHETLARLLPQLGDRDGGALDSYQSALADRPDSRPLWLSAIGSAKAVGDFEQMRSWADVALNRFGDTPDMKMLRASADVAAMNWNAARPQLEDLVKAYPESHSAQLALGHVLLAQGDASRAESHALAASRLNPYDQSAWALLCVIWRLLDDPREHWLADYERLVMPIDLAPPAGWSDLPTFLADLRVALEALHSTQYHPAEQSLRGGTQTRGSLFSRRHPAITGLSQSIRTAILEKLADLPRDTGHPFLNRIGVDVAFAGSWSVRLASEGFHISHIHPLGWLSSACYIALPPEVVRGDDHAGALQFGTPDSAFGLDLAPRRVVAPVEGRLVIFPSYLWHGTLPFESSGHRLTVAFDALPGGDPKR